PLRPPLPRNRPAEPRSSPGGSRSRNASFRGTMGVIDASVQPSLTPDDESALKDILGYLNFSSGAADSRFQRHLDRMHAWFVLEDGMPRIRRLLEERLAALAASVPAFRDSEQARSILGLVFDGLVPAYRKHHKDLLLHVPAEDFYQPFF